MALNSPELNLTVHKIYRVIQPPQYKLRVIKIEEIEQQLVEV